MASTRSELREKIMIILYQIYVYQAGKMEYDVKDVIKENCEVENEFVNDIVYGVLEKTDELDELINRYLNNWKIKRLGKTDQAILRLSTYELLYYNTPAVVAINEGIELAKKFSDDKVSGIINGVLDNIRDNEGKNE